MRAPHRSTASTTFARGDRLSGRSVRLVYLSKSAALVALLGVVWLLHIFVSGNVPAGPVSAVVALVLLPNLAVVLWPADVPVILLALSVVADVAGVTAGIHFGGGVDMVSGPLLYIAVIGLAAYSLSERAALLATGACIVGYNLLVWAEYRGLLAHYLPYIRPAEDQATTAIMVTVGLLLVALVMSHAERQQRAAQRRAEQLRTEAVGALSHDLKNPLAAIAGYAEMAGEAPPAEITEFLQRIRGAARLALDLVSNALDAAALEDRPMTVQPAPVRLNELVEQAVGLYGSTACGKGVRLTTALAPALPVIDADPQLLKRAIGNLVSNAIKYTNRGGAVQVATGLSADGTLTVTVEDSGCGIPTDEQSSLFQKYVRAPSVTAAEGTGLGLYIVRRIAEGHGGSAHVRSEVGTGSVFTLQLPQTGRHPPEPPSEERPSAPPAVGTGEATSAGARRRQVPSRTDATH